MRRAPPKVLMAVLVVAFLMISSMAMAELTPIGPEPEFKQDVPTGQANAEAEIAVAIEARQSQMAEARTVWRGHEPWPTAVYTINATPTPTHNYHPRWVARRYLETKYLHVAFLMSTPDDFGELTTAQLNQFPPYANEGEAGSEIRFALFIFKSETMPPVLVDDENLNPRMALMKFKMVETATASRGDTVLKMPTLATVATDFIAYSNEDPTKTRQPRSKRGVYTIKCHTSGNSVAVIGVGPRVTTGA